MLDIDLNGIDIRSRGKTYRIPFHPALSSLSEARPRLVEMDKLSALYLKKSDITVKRFVLPYGKWLIGFVITAGFFYGASFPEIFSPQGPVGKHLSLSVQPAVQNLAVTYGPKTVKYLAVVHALEAAYFMRYVLPKHSVSARAPQFWLWAISVLFEGIGAQGRFKEVVEKSRAAKEKQRHF